MHFENRLNIRQFLNWYTTFSVPINNIYWTITNFNFTYFYKDVGTLICNTPGEQRNKNAEKICSETPTKNALISLIEIFGLTFVYVYHIYLSDSFHKISTNYTPKLSSWNTLTISENQNKIR